MYIPLDGNFHRNGMPVGNAKFLRPTYYKPPNKSPSEGPQVEKKSLLKFSLLSEPHHLFSTGDRKNSLKITPKSAI